MPYPNEHAARMLDPGSFVEGSMRSKQMAPGVRAIMGKLRSNPSKMVVQALRFDREKFTPEEAREWCREHKFRYSSFEAASGK